MTYHELFGFMSQELASEILEYAYGADKQLYRATLAAVAEAKRQRPTFYEKRPRAERHADMLGMLSRPRMEEVASTLLRTWLIKTKTSMLADFLDKLAIPHESGIVKDFPAQVEDAKLTAAVESLLASYPPEVVIVYLQAFYAMNEVRWQNLEALLQNDARLQFS